MQSWCVNLLAIPVDAYKLGTVIGKGALIQAGGDNILAPDVMFVAGNPAMPDDTASAPLLAIDIIHRQTPQPVRKKLQALYARAHMLEYWQIEADSGRFFLYQANAAWKYDLIPPDVADLHFSTAIVELSFPVVWFTQLPDIWTMMAYWGMIEDLGHET